MQAGGIGHAVGGDGLDLPVAGVLEVAHHIHPAVHVIDALQASALGTRRGGEDAAELLGIDVVRPEKVVDMHAAVFADEQGAQLFRELDVVGVGDLVRIGEIAQGIGRGQVFAHQRGRRSHVHRHPLAVHRGAAGVHLPGLEVEGVHRTGLRPGDFEAGDRAIDHRRLDIGHGGVGDLVFGVDGRAFHFGEGHGAAHEPGVAVGFEEGCRLFLPRNELDPVFLAAQPDLGVGGIDRVGGFDVHDAGRAAVLRRGLRQRQHFRAGGMAEVHPFQREGAGAHTRSAGLRCLSNV